MTTVTDARAGDPRLDEFLGATTDAAAAAALELLLGGEADRVIRETVCRGLSGTRLAAAHGEDVASEVRLRLVRKLWSLRRGADDPIENFLGYAATTAERACYAFFRTQYPERARFRNRVRYAVAHHPETRLVCHAQGVWQSGRRQGPRPIAAPGSAQLFLDDPRGWLAGHGLDATMPLPALIGAVLTSLDSAVDLDRLVEALASVLGITDRPHVVADDTAARVVEQIPDPSSGIGDVLEHREALRRVWNEIVVLPARQRAALLLNLRDPEGGAVLQTLPSTGVVSKAQIASALDVDLDELTGLWDRLPLDDLAVAAMLGLTRQQVINLRKSARARLARRLRMTEW